MTADPREVCEESRSRLNNLLAQCDQAEALGVDMSDVREELLRSLDAVNGALATMATTEGL